MTIEKLTTYQKLADAFYSCKKPSWWKEQVQRYEANLSLNLLELQREVREGVYRVSPTNNFTINERGKIRHIKAPNIKDRIIQKVLCKYILVPQLTKYLIYDNYASLKDRGTSFARKRIDILLRKYINMYGSDGYILQVDIRKFFDNVDHKVLKRMLHERIHEPKEIMELIDYIVDSSSEGDKGLNLGSEAPQIFAIFYLTEFDNYIKTVKGVKYYGRYMDDMFIISHDKEYLKSLLVDIKKQLKAVKLNTNARKTHITKLSHGFTFMQIKYHVDNGHIVKRPTHKKIARERRKLRHYKKQFNAGNLNEFDINNCYKSWRNVVIKDCNACKSTIQSIDSLYNVLFPVKQKYNKFTRTQIIDRIYKDYFEPQFATLNY